MYALQCDFAAPPSVGGICFPITRIWAGHMTRFGQQNEDKTGVLFQSLGLKGPCTFQLSALELTYHQKNSLHQPAGG